MEAPVRGTATGTADANVDARPRPGTQRRMSLRDVSFQSSYNPDNCSDIIGRLYEPALAESVPV